MRTSLLTIALLLCCVTAWSAGPPSGVRTSLAFTPVYQLQTDLSGGGSFAVDRYILRFDQLHSTGKRLSLGYGLSYDFENWRFRDSGTLAQASPWSQLHLPTLSVSALYRTGNSWAFLVAPSIGLSQVAGAESRRSLVYGAVITSTRAFDRNRRLGLGLGAFNRLGRARLFPLLAIDWQINKMIKLQNPLRSGPTGPAGLELAWTIDSDWQLGTGGAWRSMRFRLEPNNALPSGIVEIEQLVAFLRLQHRLNDRITADLFCGGLFAGRLETDDSAARSVDKTGFATAPFLGLTLRGKF